MSARPDDLDQATNRALWAIDVARGLRDLEQRHVTDRDEVYEALARELSRP